VWQDQESLGSHGFNHASSDLVSLKHAINSNGCAFASCCHGSFDALWAEYRYLDALVAIPNR
jgi:hypothetical protein